MSTYKTGNPLGSAAVKDLFDNAENLDFALNSLTALIWTDRLGKTRCSFFGMESAFVTQLTSQESRFNTFIQSSGYQIVGDYTAGPLTITEYNQLIRYNNELYKLTAATDIPFTTAGNTDETWTSTDAAHFVSVGDAALRQNLGSSEEGLGDDIVTHSDGKTVREHIKYLERDKLSFYGSTATGLLNFLAYAAASGRECIVDTVVNLTIAVNFDAQFSNIHLRWEAPINSDTQLFNLHNLGPKSILKDMWFQNITAPWVINRWDTDGNWIDNAETIANSVVQTNEEAGYQPTASDKDVWPLLSDTVKNQQICGGPVIHTSRGVSVLNPRGRYIAITFMDCNFCTVSEPSVMGGKHQYGTILFNNTGTTAWGKGNKVIDGEVRYGSTSGVVYMRHKGKSNRIYGTNAYRCGESGFKTYQNEVNGRSARCYGVKWDNLTAEQCYYDGFDLASDYGEAAQRVDDYTLAQFAWNLLPLKHEVTNLTAIGCHGTGAWGDGQGSTYRNLHIEDCYSSGTNFIGEYNIIDDVFSKNNNRKNGTVSDPVAQIKVPGKNNKVSKITIIVDDAVITGGYGLYAPSSMATDIDKDWCTLPSLPSFSEMSSMSLGSYSSTETQVWIDGHPRGAFLANAIGRLLFELTYGTSGSERGNAALLPVFNGVFTKGLRVRGENGGMAIMGVPSQSNAAYLDNGTAMFYESGGVLKIQFKNAAGTVTTYTLTQG
ncbi:tail spike protein [Klebsiella michiganensis]